MGALHLRHSQNYHYHYHILKLSIILTALIFLLLASETSAITLKTTQLGGQMIERDRGRIIGWTLRAMDRVLFQMRVVGPGSSPPTCRSKCGRCSPCKPVHVAIQPGMSIPLEYYPEAWRCKCGNKLFMP